MECYPLSFFMEKNIYFFPKTVEFNVYIWVYMNRVNYGFLITGFMGFGLQYVFTVLSMFSKSLTS